MNENLFNSFHSAELDNWEASNRTYQAQYYVNGSNCDLTSRPRQTELRFSVDFTINSEITLVTPGLSAMRLPPWSLWGTFLSRSLASTPSLSIQPGWQIARPEQSLTLFFSKALLGALVETCCRGDSSSNRLQSSSAQGPVLKVCFE